LDDPVAARQLNWAVEDLPAGSLYAPRRGIYVADVKVVKPEGSRHDWGFGDHSAQRLTPRREELIGAHFPDVGVRALPAEELAVESKRFLPVTRQQFVPADLANCAQVGGLL
jgi:hypothetical protein